MTDVARLRKAVEYSLSLPQAHIIARPGGSTGDQAELPLGLLRFSPPGGDLAYWDQNQWLAAWAGEESEVRWGEPVRITEEGVINAQGLQCRTAACIAGNTVLLFAPDGTEITNCHGWAQVHLPDGRWLELCDYAEELLGLCPDDAEELFAGENRTERVRDIAGRIIAEANE
jgi:hypothetical protein